MKERTTAQICARMRAIRESRTFHHPIRHKVERQESIYESTMVVRSGRKLTGAYKTVRQVADAYEQEEWERENRYQMFEAGKGTRFTKRTHVNKGAHFTKKSVSSTNRPTAHGEVCTVGRQIVVKRFSNSRLTCVCKSVVY